MFLYCTRSSVVNIDWKLHNDGINYQREHSNTVVVLLIFKNLNGLGRTIHVQYKGLVNFLQCSKVKIYDYYNNIISGYACII